VPAADCPFRQWATEKLTSDGLQELNGPAVLDGALMAIITFGSLMGSMLPFVLKGSRPLHRRHSWRHWSMSLGW